MRAYLASLLLASGLGLWAQEPNSSPWIGAVEEHKKHIEGAPLDFALRPLFHKQGGVWTTRTIKVPSGTQWTVGLRGKALGRMETGPPVADSFISAQGLLTLGTPVPGMTKPSPGFNSWMGPLQHRPHIATLGESTLRPSSWRHAKPTKAHLAAITKAFIGEVSYLPVCDANGKSISPQPRTRPQDVEVFDVLVHPKDGSLIGARIKPSLWNHCDGVQGREASDFWFHSPHGQPTTVLSGFPDGDDALSLSFLDAAEVDGEEILLFWCNGYNQDGYILFSDSLRSSARFMWSYH